MMRSFAFVSLKGGVGKTTIALNTAFAFARRRVRTLLVDFDPQGAVANSIEGVGERRGLAANLRSGALLAGVVSTRIEELDLLPMGAVDVADVDAFTSAAREADVVRRVLIEGDERYDVVLFDTPAGLGGMTRLALETVDHAVAVTQCEPLSLRALPRLLELLAQLRSSGSACALLGVVASMASFRDPVVLASLEEVWSLYRDHVFDTSIPRDAAFLQASRAGVPLGLLSRRPPPAAASFDALVAEIEARTLTQQKGESDDGPIRLVD